MTMHKAWYRMNINVSDAISNSGYKIIEEWKASTGDNPAGYWRLYHDELKSFFNQSFLDQMAEKNMPVASIITFYRKSNYIHPTAHIDGSLFKKPIYAINWCVGNDTSDMVWYERPNETPEINTTTYDTPHYEYQTKELIEFDRLVIGNQATIVRVDLPHNIIVRETPRFVVSLRFQFEEFDSWEHALKYFKKYIVI